MDARRLVRLYPRAWRERYGDELLALLDARPPTWRIAANILMSATRERCVATLGRRRSAARQCPQCHADVSQRDWTMFVLQSSIVGGARAAPCQACGALLRLSAAQNVQRLFFGAALAVGVFGRWFGGPALRLSWTLIGVQAACFAVAFFAQRRLALTVVPVDRGDA